MTVLRMIMPASAISPRSALKPNGALNASNEKLAPIIKHLHSLSGKPATRKKLAQTIANYFRQHGGALPDSSVEQLIDELIHLKYVSQNGSRVSYHLS